jgi:hypothetical protein
MFVADKGCHILEHVKPGGHRTGDSVKNLRGLTWAHGPFQCTSGEVHATLTHSPASRCCSKTSRTFSCISTVTDFRLATAWVISSISWSERNLITSPAVSWPNAMNKMSIFCIAGSSASPSSSSLCVGIGDVGHGHRSSPVIRSCPRSAGCSRRKKLQSLSRTVSRSINYRYLTDVSTASQPLERTPATEGQPLPASQRHPSRCPGLLDSCANGRPGGLFH